MILGICAVFLAVVTGCPSSQLDEEAIRAQAISGTPFIRPPTPLRVPETTTTTAPPTTTTTAPPVVTTTTTTAPAPTPTTSPASPPPAAAPSSSGGWNDPNNPATWDRLAQCESGGDWSTNTGNGYYGGIQFALSSWRGVGGTGYPHEHSREEQIYRGQLLWQQGGWDHWPACSDKLGYR